MKKVVAKKIAPKAKPAKNAPAMPKAKAPVRPVKAAQKAAPPGNCRPPSGLEPKTPLKPVGRLR